MFTRAIGGAYLVSRTQDTVFDGRTLRPVDGGRGLVPNHNLASHADDDALVTSPGPPARDDRITSPALGADAVGCSFPDGQIYHDTQAPRGEVRDRVGNP